MKDEDCIGFLQWSLPRLRLRWQGFRKVRGQVCKRIDRRMREIGARDVAAYRACLEDHPEEWPVLDSFCRITISRFFRDRGVFKLLETDILPRLAEKAQTRGENVLRCWSIGCASGEEPYSLALVWKHAVGVRYPGLSFSIVATDADPKMIERAQRGWYPAGSLKELPDEWKERSFAKTGNDYCLRPDERGGVVFTLQDVRTSAPEGLFHLILCRNLAFTYFDEAGRRDALRRIREKLVPGGVLVIGIHETLPEGAAGFTALSPKQGVYLFPEQE